VPVLVPVAKRFRIDQMLNGKVENAKAVEAAPGGDSKRASEPRCAPPTLTADPEPPLDRCSGSRLTKP